MKKLLIISTFLLFTGVTFGQTIKEGVVVAVHSVEVVLNPDITMNQYLNAINDKWIPAFEKNFPGIKVFILKGDRGQSKNRMGILYVCDSKETRDRYWPAQDEASDIALAAQEKMQAVLDEIEKMQVTFSTRYTDWIIQKGSL